MYMYIYKYIYIKLYLNIHRYNISKNIIFMNINY